MITFNQKELGGALVGVAVLLIVVLGFVKASVDEQEAFLCTAVHTNPDIEMSQCPAHQSNNSWMLLVAFGIGFLILVGGGVLIALPPKSLARKKVKPKGLTADEKKIYSLLEGAGSMYQSDLVKELEFSKVKMTRILDKLEQKGVIERKRRGMTNIVVLK